jgi:alkanesulfonate monooxygenase SsuD/methylene tetrahydromethanopterin reductase-like flavin-dependent oxidoreductase (luciferase family)
MLVALANSELNMAPNPLRDSEHRLGLAVFGINVSSGCTMTSAPGTLGIDWPETKSLALAAEAAGFDALIPVARWKGMGGTVNFNHRSWEPFTMASALAAVTERIALFSTCHVPTVHPVRMAKEVATIDQISGGRFCLNIVAGWNEREIGMFGVQQKAHDERYDVADDWIEFTKRLWDEPAEFDYAGPYFTSPGAYSQPKPVQAPHPLIMSAGNSPRGLQFAAKHADLNFVVAPDLATAAENARNVRELAAEQGRKIKVFGQGYIVCRDTQAEANAFRDQYVNELGDWDGVRNLLDVLIPNSQSALGDQWEAMAANMIAGYGALPLVGTPDQVVAGMRAFADAGLDGLTVSWVDYAQGIEQFDKQLRPRLVEAGLRAY